MGSEVTKIGLRMIINQRLISQSENAFSFVHLNIKSSFSKHSFLYHFIRFGKMCFCFFSPRGNVEKYRAQLLQYLVSLVGGASI